MTPRGNLVAIGKMRFPTRPGTVGHYVIFNLAQPVKASPFEESRPQDRRTIRAWLRDNTDDETWRIVPGGIIFDHEDDAMMCFMAFR